MTISDVVSDVDVVVIGGGVVGAAVLQRLAASGRSCWLLDRAPRIGGETTERNSGVIHAGLYYPADSLKTRLCIRGNRLIYAWAALRGVPHMNCGKLVVARDAREEAGLERMLSHATGCGVPDLRMVTAAEMAAIEPNAIGISAVWSGSTGVVDPFELTASLSADAEAHDAEVLLNAAVTAIEATADGWALETARGRIVSSVVVNSAGLYADDVAAMAGVDGYRLYPCRGDYFWLRGRRKYNCLVYPAKVPGAPNLGIHLTIDPDGNTRLGPDATWVDDKGDYGPAEHKRDAFAQAAATLLRDVRPEDLAYDSCGMRPKLRSRHEPDEKDFVIAEDRPGLINLIGIESPGLTSAMAIAEEVERLLG